jgi:hydrogenase maturation protease
LRIIVGYGNTLRGEDGFGADLIDELAKHDLKETKLLKTFQLTPELALELKEYDEIIFIDAAHSEYETYELACSLQNTTQNTLSHHISIKMMISILNSLYDHYPSYEVYSMLTNNYDEIADKKRYNSNISKIVKYFNLLYT